MQTTARHRSRLAAAALCLVWLAACTSTPVAEGDGTTRVVVRTPTATVWATPEAALAAAAPPAAPARPADARPVGSSGASAASSSGTARASNAGGGATATGGASSFAPSAAPGTARASVGAESSAAAGAVLAQTLYFDFDRFDIKDEFRPLLEGHAQVLAADRSVRLVIEGHADERGGAEYNLALGQKRAHAVAKALSLLGVADSQVEAVSFGDTRPVVPDSTEEAWARNRRAEIKRR